MYTVYEHIFEKKDILESHILLNKLLLQVEKGKNINNFLKYVFLTLIKK